MHTIVDKITSTVSAHIPSGRWFIKLDTRSAKDAVLYDFDNPVIQNLLRQSLTGISPDDLQTSNVAFVKATNHALACQDAWDALALFRNSTRITQDLSRQLEFGAEHCQISLVLREWLDEIIERPQYEFRCFVHELRLNAITQYFDWIHFPELVERKAELLQLLTDFFYAVVAPNAPYRSFVIDFYVSRDNQVRIIEFNPFHNGAGAGLFSWARDRELFLNGPLEFRVLEAPPEDILEADIIPPRWHRWIRVNVWHLSPEVEDSSDSSSFQVHPSLPFFLIVFSVLGLAFFISRKK